MLYAPNLSSSTIRKNQGSSLIEVLVALFLMVIGLLGVLSMQVKSKQYAQSSFYYTQAVYLANEILESMRSNPDGVGAYLIGLDDEVLQPKVSCIAVNVLCSPEQVKQVDLYHWRQNVEQSLLSGKSSIEVLGDHIAIKVQYSDRSFDVKNSATSVFSEYVLVTEINQ